MDNEQLKKSVDELLEEFFAEETVVKAQASDSEVLADDVKAPKSKKDDGEDRPEEVSDVPAVDEDGSRAKGYDAVQKPQNKTPEISANGAVVKSFEVSEEDMAILKKAKAAMVEEELKKAQTVQADLIKSAVVEATQGIREENESLKKSLNETMELVKAFAKQPKQQKSIANIASLEKSFGGDEQPVAKSFTKNDMLDAAEELVKSNKITDLEYIELNDTGAIYNPAARAEVEKYLRRSSK